MRKYGEDILHCLDGLKGSGKFATVGEAPFVFPGLEVEGLGEIAFPVNELQANLLIQKAHKAPFGKGAETVYDDEVRSGWEIDADKLHIHNPQWHQFLKHMISKVKSELGLDGCEVEAKLYKLLIYEEGDFFLTHKDSEKEKGMFGSLIVNLPARFSGGELAIRFEGEEMLADFSKTAYSMGYAAFYADCDHEVKPVISGYRICLTYNLIQKKQGQKITLQSIKKQVDILAGIFEAAVNENGSKPCIVLLDHQYTPENFSGEALKLNDRYKAEVMMRAAKSCGCYAKMCLVTSYVIGIPAYDGYDDTDEFAVMEEVLDKRIEIEHWATNQYPDLDHLYVAEEDLIAGFNLDGEEPLERENSGYMGNYGPDLEHWYHYGAVVVWSQEACLPLLLSQHTPTQLAWIDYFNQQQEISDTTRKAVYGILGDGLTRELSYRDEMPDYNVIAQWLIKQADRAFFLTCSDERLRFLFEKITVEYWIKLFSFWPLKISLSLFERLAQVPDLIVLEKWLEMEKCIFEEKGFSVLAKKEMEALPQVIARIDSNSLRGISKNALANLFWIARFMPSTKEWNEHVAKQFLAIVSRDFVHETLGPQLLLTDHFSLLKDILLQGCCQLLQKRADDIPQEPQDWSRPVPDTEYNKDEWQILKPFLLSPTAIVFNYKAAKTYRNTMEYAIKEVSIDLKMETIKEGSPHVLRITKTKAAYHRAMEKWIQDKELLRKLKDIK